MRTTDLFNFNRSSQRLNESLEKLFGQKINFEEFDTAKLEDARNKLRTQIHTARTSSGFNETVENENLAKAQFMHDAIVAELMDRQEHIVDNTVQEGSDLDGLFDQWMNSEHAPMDDDSGDDNKVFHLALRFLDGQVPEDDIESYAEELADRFHGGTYDDEGGDTDDAYALASAGHGSDEDYGDYGGHEESVEMEGDSPHSDMSIAQDVYAENPDLDSEDDILNAAFPHVVKMMGGNKKRANYLFNYDEDFPGEMISAYKWLQRHEHDVGEAGGFGRDAYQRDYDSSVSGFGRRNRADDWDEGNTEPPNNFAIYINGKKWKVFAGRGTYADDRREQAQYQQLRDWARKKSEATGKKWEVMPTGENPTESVSNESINTGDNMRNLREGEIQQASAIVTAKTMVDRVGRWIEELSGMENDTLLQLGDSIRDEMGQEQAKGFIEAVAPAIQQALENLKSTREALASGVRTLTGEEQSAGMLGAEPGAEEPMGGEEEMGAAGPDAMNAEPTGDEFDAAEPAAGGMETAGREQRESIQRESIQRSSSLLRALAG